VFDSAQLTVESNVQHQGVAIRVDYFTLGDRVIQEARFVVFFQSTVAALGRSTAPSPRNALAKELGWLAGHSP
jgi:hypothetical protein